MESISLIPDSKISVFLEYPEPTNPKEDFEFCSQEKMHPEIVNHEFATHSRT